MQPSACNSQVLSFNTNREKKACAPHTQRHTVTDGKDELSRRGARSVGTNEKVLSDKMRLMRFQPPGIERDRKSGYGRDGNKISGQAGLAVVVIVARRSAVLLCGGRIPQARVEIRPHVYLREQQARQNDHGRYVSAHLHVAT